MSLRVVRKDRGADDFMSKMRALAGKPVHIDIGVFDPVIAPRAAAHELGMGVPVRSWLRGTLAAHGRKALIGILRTMAKKDPGARTFERFGVLMVALIQERLAGNIEPALKEPRTEGGRVNLVFTEAFRNAISWRFDYRKGKRRSKRRR